MRLRVADKIDKDEALPEIDEGEVESFRGKKLDDIDKGCGGTDVSDIDSHVEDGKRGGEEDSKGVDLPTGFKREGKSNGTKK